MVGRARVPLSGNTVTSLTAPAPLRSKAGMIRQSRCCVPPGTRDNLSGRTYEVRLKGASQHFDESARRNQLLNLLSRKYAHGASGNGPDCRCNGGSRACLVCTDDRTSSAPYIRSRICRILSNTPLDAAPAPPVSPTALSREPALPPSRLSGALAGDHPIRRQPASTNPPAAQRLARRVARR